MKGVKTSSDTGVEPEGRTESPRSDNPFADRAISILSAHHASARPSEFHLDRSACEKMFVHFPKVLQEFRPMLADALACHETSNVERAYFAHLFHDTASVRRFMGFHVGRGSYGLFWWQHASVGMNQGEYLGFLEGQSAYYISLNAELFWSLLSDGTLSFDHENRDEWMLTLRHEIDHFVHFIVTLMRQYRNAEEFNARSSSVLHKRKTEFFAFYHQSNYAMHLKWDGMDISWENILRHHTGFRCVWSPDLDDSYRWVVDYVRPIMEARISIYNRLSREFWFNPNPSNPLAALHPVAQKAYSDFAQAIWRGVDAAESIQELDAFFRFVIAIVPVAQMSPAVVPGLRSAMHYVSPQTNATASLTAFRNRFSA